MTFKKPQNRELSLSRLNEGTMIASGMGMIGNDKRTSELKLASIQMLSKSQCKSIEFPGSLFKGKCPKIFPSTKNYIKMVWFVEAWL